MKGVNLPPAIIVAFAIGMIAIAVSIVFFMYLTDLELVGLTGDLATLRQYSTCVLAYCAAGAGSDEVNAVGCLNRTGGKCVMTCADVENEVYNKSGVKPTFQEPGPILGGREAYHYCGPDANLTFEFQGPNIGGYVRLQSGQMDTLAKKPEWVCKPMKAPFTDLELDDFGLGTADGQHKGFAPFNVPQNCVILSGPRAQGQGFPGRQGCFRPIKYDESVAGIYYTPLIQYDDPAQIVYPSAIYVDETFTEPLDGKLRAECDYRNPPGQGTVTKQDVLDKISKAVGDNSNTTTLADLSGSDNLVGNVLNRCNFEERYEGKKIKYKVWAKPVYPDLDVFRKATAAEQIEDFMVGILGFSSFELRFTFDLAAQSAVEGLRTLLSQTGGSCTAVVLSRDLD